MNDEEKHLILRSTLHSVIVQARSEGGMAVVNAILGHPRAVELIQSMDAQELYALMLDVGKADSADLVRWTTPDQMQGLVDLDAWKGDRYDPERFETLMALFASAGEESVECFFDSLEDEVVALYVLSRCKVLRRTFEPEQDDEIAAYPDVITTPDSFFYLLPHEGGEGFAKLKFFVEGLYSRDAAEATGWMNAAAGEDFDSLQEEGARFKGARIASMGFPPLDETESLSSYLNPIRFKKSLREKLERLPPIEPSYDSLLPALLRLGQTGPDFLRSVSDHLENDEVRARVGQGMAWLINATIVRLSQGDLGNEETQRGGLEKALCLVNMALEYLAESRPTVGAMIIARVRPATLFRVGNSLLVMLRLRALKLRARSGAEHGFNLFDPPLDDVIKGATMSEPMYFVGLDEPDKSGFREFACLRERRRTVAALEQAEGVADFVERSLKPDPAELARLIPERFRPSVTHTTLMATALVNGFMGNTPLLRPVPLSSMPAVVDALLVQDPDGRRKVNPRLAEAIEHFTEEGKDAFASALLDLAVRKLEDVFGRFPNLDAVDPAFLASAVLVDAEE